MERELAASGWTLGAGNNTDLTKEEMQGEIEKAEEALDDNLRRRAEQAGITILQGAPPGKKKRLIQEQATLDTASSECCEDGEQPNPSIYGS
jgi:hypothetical protein